jgi:transposase
MGQDTTASFARQHFHFGIDVHLRKWVVTVRTGDMLLKTVSMEPSPEALHRFATKNYPDGIYHSAYEAGFCGFRIHRRLTALGFGNIVCHASDIPTTQKERFQRTDTRDSGKIAKQLEKNDLNAVFVPDEAQQHLRSLCRLRFKARGDATRTKNRIKSLLHLNGVELPRQDEMHHWSGAFVRWIEELPLDGGPGRFALGCLVEDLRHKRAQLLRVTRELRRCCRQGPDGAVVGLLLTVPGVGFVTAATLYTELMDMGRFPDPERLACYVGLVPRTDQSDETDPNPGITPRKNRYLSSLAIEAAWVAVRHDPRLLARFTELTRRMKRQDAIVRIARNVLSRVRYVWRTRKPCKQL